MFSSIPLTIIELWLISVGFIGKLTQNGKNWYRYSSHWSFICTLLCCFRKQWKTTRKSWKNSTITLINTSRYNTIRLLISFIIVIGGLSGIEFLSPCINDDIDRRARINYIKIDIILLLVFNHRAACSLFLSFLNITCMLLFF